MNNKFKTFLALGAVAWASASMPAEAVQVSSEANCTRCITEDMIYPKVTKEVVKDLIKGEFGDYADTMGTKEKHTVASDYFNKMFNSMKEVAEQAPTEKCVAPANKLRQSYKEAESLVESSVLKNVDINLNNKASVTKKAINNELYQGKTKEVIVPQIKNLRAKAFALGDCLKERRPMEFK